jgi:hypothetical protein
MIKIKSTVLPTDRQEYPKNRPLMLDILDYWSMDGNKFNEQLYLKILKTKK